jgi:hypothetical protein
MKLGEGARESSGKCIHAATEMLIKKMSLFKYSFFHRFFVCITYTCVIRGKKIEDRSVATHGHSTSYVYYASTGISAGIS